MANVLLLATLVFSEWLALETRLIGSAVLAVVWLLARWQSRTERLAFRLDATEATGATDATDATDEQELSDEEASERPPAERDLLFREAQGYYLSNDWVAAEQVLLKMLKQDARDVESRLMLATLWRHQGRGAEAVRQLDRIERLEAASRWQHEIAAERMAIDDANNETAHQETKEQEPEEDQRPQEDQRSDAPLERTEPETSPETTKDTEHRRAA
ncbi:MAG: hypothetical protein GXP24_06295 [Planctomycetes bacterium]|nr:hypothetical protein [Planctomycetota bacterium]